MFNIAVCECDKVYDTLMCKNALVIVSCVRMSCVRLP